MPLFPLVFPIWFQVAAPPPQAVLVDPVRDPVAAAAPETARTLHLEEAVQSALRRQPAVLQAQATSAAASGRSEQARAGLLPQITGTALYQRVHGSLARGNSSTIPATTTTTTTPTGVASTSATSGSGTYDYFSFGASASQLLWDFGQTYERYRAAERQVGSFKASEKSAELQVLFNVRRAFFAARAQHALVGVAREALENQQRHLAQIQGFVSVGTRPEIDLAQARTDLANDRVALINAQGNSSIAKAQLGQAMGGGPDGDYEVADEELTPVDGEELATTKLVERALADRPELLALERQREAQETTVRSLKGAYGPTLAAVGGASETGTSLDALGPNWNVGATLTWPLFQGGLTRGQVHEAEGNLGVTHAQLEAERLQIHLDVEQALIAVRGAKASIEAANDAQVNARERLRLAEGRYASGVGSSIELGDAQLALTSASAQSVQAQFNLSTARAQLMAALGRR